MRKKSKFKRGDRVKHKFQPRLKSGTVISGGSLVCVSWDRPRVVGNHYPEYLEFYETPIQRMKRKYYEG